MGKNAVGHVCVNKYTRKKDFSSLSTYAPTFSQR